MVSGLVVVVLRVFFLHAPNIFVWLRDAPKHILCTLHISHVFKVFLDPLYLAFHLIKLYICLIVSSCFYAQNKPTFYKNLLNNVVNNPINPKAAPPPQKKKKKTLTG